MTLIDQPTPVNFRAIPAVKRVIELVIGNLGPLTQMVWPWIVAVVVIAALSIFLAFLPALLSCDDCEPVFPLGIVVGLNVMLWLLAFSAVAVMIHRFFLQGEVPCGRARFQIDQTVWLYFGNMILILLIVLALLAAMTFFLLPLLSGFLMVAWQAALRILPEQVVGFVFSYMTSAILSLPLAYVLTRLSIKLPAVAIRKRDYGLGSALRDTKRCYIQFLIFVVLVNLAVFILDNVLTLVLSPLANIGLAIGIISFLLQLFLSCVGLAIGIVALTVLYGIFAENRSI